MQAKLSTLFPNRPPTWSEVLVATGFFVLYGRQLVFDIFAGSVASWPAVIAGIALPICFALVWKSSLGTGFGQWYESKSRMSRIVVTIAVATIIMTGPFWAPTVLYLTAVRSFLIGYFVYIVAHLVWTREISGLSPALRTNSS